MPPIFFLGHRRLSFVRPLGSPLAGEPAVDAGYTVSSVADALFVKSGFNERDERLKRFWRLWSLSGDVEF